MSKSILYSTQEKFGRLALRWLQLSGREALVMAWCCFQPHLAIAPHITLLAHLQHDGESA